MQATRNVSRGGDREEEDELAFQAWPTSRSPTPVHSHAIGILLICLHGSRPIPGLRVGLLFEPLAASRVTFSLSLTIPLLRYGLPPSQSARESLLDLFEIFPSSEICCVARPLEKHLDHLLVTTMNHTALKNLFRYL